MAAECCVYCQHDLPEAGLYCPQCLHQVRCKSCGKLLRPNAAGCIFCGTPLGATGITAISDGIADVARQGMNTLKFEETRAGRSLEVHFSDSVAESIGGALTGLLISGTVTSAPRTKRSPIMEQAPIQERLAIPSVAREMQDVVHVPPASQPAPPSVTGDGERERMHRIFQFEENGRIWLDDTRLKATSHADATRRLTYLVVYACELEGRRRISRTELNDVLRDVGLYDGNSSKALNESDFVLAGDEIGLRATGREQAQVYMHQVLDQNVADAWPLGSAMNGRKSNASSKTGGEAATKPRRSINRAPSQAVEKWVADWQKLSLGIDGHRSVQQASNTDKGIIGLWAIRKAVGEAGNYVGTTQLSKFIQQAFVVKVAKSTLTAALASEAAKGKVLRITGTTYQITPTGEEYAKQLVGL